MGYCIDHNGNRIEISGRYIDVPFMNLVELILPEECEICDCTHNQLTNLFINEKCDLFFCPGNFSPFLQDLTLKNKKLVNQIFKVEDSNLRTMLLSHDEVIFKLGMNLLNGILYK